MRHPALGAATLVVLVAVSYIPALANGFVWDDRHLVVENDALVRPGAVWSAFGQDFWESEEQIGGSDYYRPLVTVSYVLDRSLHGLQPRGYHVTNLLLHASVVVLLFLYLLHLGVEAGVATAAAALFAVHPVMAESAAWVSGRTDSLAAAWVLLCLLADTRRGRRWVYRVVALMALAAGLLSKEIAVVAPAIAIMAVMRQGLTLRRAIASRGDMLAVLAGYVVLRSLVLGNPVAREANWNLALDWSTRLAALPHLVGILVLPTRSRIEYGSGLPAGPLLFSAVAGLALLVLLALASRHQWPAARAASTARRVGGGQAPGVGSGQPVLRFLLLCGLVALVPAAAAVLVKGVVADRLVYLAAVFLLPAIGLQIAPLMKGRSPSFSRGARAALVILILALAAATSVRSARWRSEESLFEAAAAAPYPSARVFVNLGIAYHDDGRLLESLEALQEASSAARLKTAEYTLGLLFLEVGCETRAVTHYRNSLSLDPGYLAPANNLGALLAETGRLAEAREVFSRALQHVRGDARDIRINLKTLGSEASMSPRPLARCGDLASIQAKLADARFLNRRALDRLKRRQLEQAGILIKAALHRDRELTAAHLNLAQLHILAGRQPAAEAVLQDILRRHPDSSEARRLLGYLRSGAPLESLP